MNSNALNILIADDDKDDVEMLKEALQNFLPHATIAGVPDGIAALRHIKTSAPPDLVFLDLNMPLKNGLNCLKDIYNLELLPATPIVIYSTSNNIKDIDEAYKHNAAFYIIKPQSFKLLSALVKFTLERLGNFGAERIDKANFVLSERLLQELDDNDILYKKF